MKTVFRVFINSHSFLALSFTLSVVSSGCAYHFGVRGRTLPGGYSSVEVPLFVNLSQEPGMEVAFTNSLIQEFEKNKVAHVVYSSRQGSAPVLVKGEILSIEYKATSPVQKKDKAPLLPEGAVLATGYRVMVTTRISLFERSTNKLLWSSLFNGESSYAAPQVFIARLNSVNPLYNLSSRRRIIESIAQDLMVEAHDRMTENF
jgi:TolB-like protein